MGINCSYLRDRENDGYSQRQSDRQVLLRHSYHTFETTHDALDAVGFKRGLVPAFAPTISFEDL